MKGRFVQCAPNQNSCKLVKMESGLLPESKSYLAPISHASTKNKKQGRKVRRPKRKVITSKRKIQKQGRFKRKQKTSKTIRTVRKSVKRRPTNKKKTLENSLP